jgi:hypothetical protein
MLLPMKFQSKVPSMFRIVLVLLALTVSGCAYNVPPMGDAVSVSGKVTSGGAPVSGVVLMLQPLEDGHPAPCKLGAEGTFEAKLVPGKYAYFVQKDADDAALAKVNAKYHAADLGRTVAVKAGQTSLDLVLD